MCAFKIQFLIHLNTNLSILLIYCEDITEEIPNHIYKYICPIIFILLKIGLKIIILSYFFLKSPGPFLCRRPPILIILPRSKK